MSMVSWTMHLIKKNCNYRENECSKIWGIVFFKIIEIIEKHSMIIMNNG